MELGGGELAIAPRKPKMKKKEKKGQVSDNWIEEIRLDYRL